MNLEAGEQPEESNKHILWAPWRKAYLVGPKVEGCLFCEAPKGEDDRADLIVARWKTCFALLNRYPYNSGHVMVAPYRHVARLEALETEERHELGDRVAQVCEVLQQAYRPQGFNVGANLGEVAGAGFAGHLHWHIVPRWKGDTNFMPVVADTKVISEALEEAWEALRELLKD